MDCDIELKCGDDNHVFYKYLWGEISFMNKNILLCMSALMMMFAGSDVKADDPMGVANSTIVDSAKRLLMEVRGSLSKPTNDKEYAITLKRYDNFRGGYNDLISARNNMAVNKESGDPDLSNTLDEIKNKLSEMGDILTQYEDEHRDDNSRTRRKDPLNAKRIQKQKAQKRRIERANKEATGDSFDDTRPVYY